MSLEASGKNMEAVCKAKEVHNKTCPYGGNATEVHLTFFDIDRLGWEEGDVICGLVLIGDSNVGTGRMRVTCDAEPDGGGRTEEEEVEVVEAVAAERELTVALSWRTARRGADTPRGRQPARQAAGTMTYSRKNSAHTLSLIHI